LDIVVAAQSFFDIAKRYDRDMRHGRLDLRHLIWYVHEKC